ncbi:MAG: RidA family protein [Planctomycetes bacterium]|nr:RidA family protein [Planctomycetota bacterium]
MIATPLAPAAIGPYSQAARAGGMVFCSGQIALDPATGQVAAGGVGEQTRRTLANLRVVLEAAGASISTVVKTTVYLKDMNAFGEMNKVYEEAFGAHRPARATVEVARLPRDVLVEIDAIAAVDG